MPVEETVRAFDAAGARRQGAATSRRPTCRRTGWRSRCEIAAREGLAPYVWLQPHYNLVERDGYERDYAPIVGALRARRRAVLRARQRLPDRQVPRRARTATRPRAEAASGYLDARGEAVLAALDEVAAAHGVAGRGGRRSPGCWPSRASTAPIASARTPEQLAAVLPAVDLQLTADQITRLDEASA